MSYCTWCDKQFEPSSSKQIYCSPECYQGASKEKITERYHIEKRKKRQGKEKKCAGGCETVLSIYNDSSMCDNCLTHKRKLSSFIKEIREHFDN